MVGDGVSLDFAAANNPVMPIVCYVIGLNRYLVAFAYNACVIKRFQQL